MSQPSDTPTLPTVAVVIPYYNGGAFIERALASVFTQSQPASEVIVVNDGSRPEERETLLQLQARYPFKLVDRDNGGQGAARNTGVAAAQADYICFLDQDDFYLTHHIRTLARAIPQDDPRFGYVYADLIEADGQGNVIRTSILREKSTHPKENIFQMLREDMFVLPSAALVSRSAFDAVGGFDTQFMGFEDDDLFLRIFRKGFSNIHLDTPVTVWCIHTESTSFSMRMIRSRFKYFKKLVALFPDEPRRNHFYLRDCLMPRFGRLFIDHVIEATKAKDSHSEEMRSILREYTAIVRANPSVGRLARLKLSVITTLALHMPAGLIRFIGALTRLPGMRMLRRMLG